MPSTAQIPRFVVNPGIACQNGTHLLASALHYLGHEHDSRNATMSPRRLLSALHRTAACAVMVTAIASLHGTPAQAGSVYSTHCSGTFGYGWGGVGGYGNGGCVDFEGELVNPYVIEIPQPRSEKEIADSAARERLWQARCRPTIRQDQYGVRRYHYAAPGCEYGKYE